MSFPSWLNNFLVNILFYGMCIGIVGGYIRYHMWAKKHPPEPAGMTRWNHAEEALGHAVLWGFIIFIVIMIVL